MEFKNVQNYTKINSKSTFLFVILLSEGVTNESLFYYKGKRYSVPQKFINTILDIQEDNNKLYVYYNKELIKIHEISEKNINYKEEHYISQHVHNNSESFFLQILFYMITLNKAEKSKYDEYMKKCMQ